MLSLIPNLLTLARLVLAPVVAWCVWRGFHVPYVAEFGPNALDHTAEMARHANHVGDSYKVWAAGLFLIAAATDLFDGMAARAFDADSRFGRVLDPIADKALVGLPLLTIAGITGFTMAEGVAPGFHLHALNPWITIPALVIVGRDLVITLLRMFASDGEGPRVTFLAKWKTALELAAVAMPIFLALPQISFGPGVTSAWLAILALAAALSLWTGLGYLAAPARR